MLAIWVLGAPFGVMALVAGSARLKRLLARAGRLVLVLGWAALLTIVANVVLLGESRSDLALSLAAPLAGLAVWVRRPDGGDDDDDDPPPEPEPDGGPDDAVACTGRARPPLPAARVRGHSAPRRVRTRTR